MAYNLFPILARLEDMPAAAFRVLAILCDIADPDHGHVAKATENQISAAIGVSVRTVRAAKAWLLFAGYLAKGKHRSQLIPVLPSMEAINARIQARQSALDDSEKALLVSTNWNSKTGRFLPVSTDTGKRKTGRNLPVSKAQNRQKSATKPAGFCHETGESLPVFEKGTTRKPAPAKACKAMSGPPTGNKKQGTSGSLRRVLKPHHAVTFGDWLAEGGPLAQGQLRAVADHLRRAGDLDAMLLAEPRFVDFALTAFCKQWASADHEHVSWPRRFADYLKAGANGLMRRQPDGAYGWTVAGMDLYARYAASAGHGHINGVAR